MLPPSAPLIRTSSHSVDCYVPHGRFKTFLVYWGESGVGGCQQHGISSLRSTTQGARPLLRVHPLALQCSSPSCHRNQDWRTSARSSYIRQKLCNFSPDVWNTCMCFYMRHVEIGSGQVQVPK